MRSLVRGSLVGFVIAALAAGFVALGLAVPVGRAYALDDALVAISITETEEVASEESESVTHADGWEQDAAGWHYWKNNKMITGEWVVVKKAPGISGIPSGLQRYWIDNDGVLAINRLVDPDSDLDKGAGYWAFASSKAYVVRGKTVVGSKVYLADDAGKLASGNSDGFVVSSKYDGAKQRYYIDKTAHAAITGKVIKVTGYGKIYNIPKQGYVLRGSKKIDKTHVLIADDGGKLCQKSGWVVTSKYSGGTKQRYWFERTSKNSGWYGARIGYFKVQKKLYYGIASTGYVFRNDYKKYNGVYYHADNGGIMKKASVINRMVNMAQGYSSPSKYLIMVDTNDTKVVVFQGSQGNWKVKYIWNCVTGKVDTPTILGTFSLGAKGYSFGHGYTCYYWSQIYGDYLFHTRKYYEGTHTLQDGRMNCRASMGCVRLMDENALWIWHNAPSGTTVVTMV